MPRRLLGFFGRRRHESQPGEKLPVGRAKALDQARFERKCQRCLLLAIGAVDQVVNPLDRQAGNLPLGHDAINPIPLGGGFFRRLEELAKILVQRVLNLLLKTGQGELFLNSQNAARCCIVLQVRRRWIIRKIATFGSSLVTNHCRSYRNPKVWLGASYSKSDWSSAGGRQLGNYFGR